MLFAQAKLRAQLIYICISIYIYNILCAQVIDFSYVHSINAEVEVVLPEEQGIVQIEVTLSFSCLLQVL